MLCNFPDCNCHPKLKPGQLYPYPGECPKGEEVRADLELVALANDLHELMRRPPRVWTDRDRFFTLAKEFDRFTRLVLFAQKQLENKINADT